MPYKDKVMKYNINEHESGIDISINDVKDKKSLLLEAFQECKEGHCSCPTEEYKKLDSMKIEVDDENLILQLESKDGAKIDINEINKHIEYTHMRVEEKCK